MKVTKPKTINDLNEKDVYGGYSPSMPVTLDKNGDSELDIGSNIS